MKRLKLLTALGMGIMASSSGMLQTQAALYLFSVDFTTKEVDNFSDYKKSFNSDTYGLRAKLITSFGGSYRMDSCPTAFTINISYVHQIRLNGLNPDVLSVENNLPDFVCSTTAVGFDSVITSDYLPSSVIDRLMTDDANYIQLRSLFRFNQSAATNGRVLELINYYIDHTIAYDFDTTYLFNYFLSDTQFQSRSSVGPGTWNFRSDDQTKVNYLFTTAGNDQYRIINTDFDADLGTVRKKYAVDYNEEFFRGDSIGANISRNFVTNSSLTTDTLTMVASGESVISQNYNYYFLNAANLTQEIVDAPIFEFEEEDCGNFLALNVGCFINNAFSYITNDAPIVSDAFTLLNAGIEMAAQTFGIIGEFADDNVFGVLILAGFGFIAVKWFLKND
jgi:hypothetical protein